MVAAERGPAHGQNERAALFETEAALRMLSWEYVRGSAGMPAALDLSEGKDLQSALFLPWRFRWES